MTEVVDYRELYEVILKLKTIEDCEEFFSDLCTYKELDSMAQRLCAAKYLLNGATYEEINKELNIAPATLSRINSCVKRGKGYKKFLK